jgi:hypothetical protein
VFLAARMQKTGPATSGGAAAFTIAPVRPRTRSTATTGQLAASQSRAAKPAHTPARLAVMNVADRQEPFRRVEAPAWVVGRAAAEEDLTAAGIVNRASLYFPGLAKSRIGEKLYAASESECRKI